MTTTDALSAPIVAQFEALVKAELQRAAEHPEVTLEEVLQRVNDKLHKVGEGVVVAVLTVAEEAAGAPHCACGRRMWSKGRETRYLSTCLGAVQLPLRRWRCPACGVERYPLLERSTLYGDCTAEWWPVVEQAVAWMPYRVAERHLGLVGAPLSDNKLQRLAGKVGGAGAAARAAAAQELADAPRAAPPAQRPERLYQEVDGCFVHGQGRGQYHEVRVGVHFETAAAGPDEFGRPPQPQRLCALASVAKEPGDEVAADSFMRLVYAQAEAQGAEWAAEMVLVNDGAAWIWRRVPEAVPLGTPRVEILDFFHAAERLGEVASAVLGPGTEAAQQAGARLRRQLQRGRLQEVLATLEGWWESSAGEAREAVRTGLGYVREHKHRMDYQRLREAGYHIGSGTVESWCKQVLHRVDGAGMRWSLPGLEAILYLRCKTLTEAWEPSPRKKAA